jgi:branched-chain amino acid transport system ATP-binding protein
MNCCIGFGSTILLMFRWLNFRTDNIGMALAGAPRLILFDEPAAGLSPSERRELVALLAAFPKHMGYVIIEHDLDIALRVVDKVTVMHNGRVLKHGTPDEIQNDEEVQAIYMGGKH